MFRGSVLFDLTLPALADSLSLDFAVERGSVSGGELPVLGWGVATSTDTIRWTRDPANPERTIDLGAGNDRVHNRTPAVATVSDGVLRMAPSCQADKVPDRICGAESKDGLSWPSPRGRWGAAQLLLAPLLMRRRRRR